MDIDLQPFCGGEFANPQLEKPFSCGAFTYATDGVVMIRVPRRNDTTDGGPIVDRVLPDFEAALRTRTFGPIPEFQTKTGKPQQACTACGGGRVLECTECDGSGIDPFSAEIPVSIARFETHEFNRRYIDLIAALPSVAVAFGDLEAEYPTYDMRTALIFRFDGGSGALMPMTRAYTKDAA
jgi:hypothetical protein